jgi:hypothetical protein
MQDLDLARFRFLDFSKFGLLDCEKFGAKFEKCVEFEAKGK